MFSKKTRNLTVAVLALIMALTLSFGLFGFNTQANALENKMMELSAATKNGNTYEWTGLGKYKAKKFVSFVELPFVGSGTVGWKCADIQDRNMYISHNENGSWKTDTSRPMKMEETYQDISFTADDVYQTDGKYYLVFTTPDDFKPTDVHYTITAAKKTYQVTYNYDDGVTQNVVTDWTEGDTALTLPTPTRTGYKFDGWNNGTATLLAAGASYEPTANIELTAQWTANTYDVTLDGATTVKATYGQPLPDVTAPTKEDGSIFTGYYDEAGNQYYYDNGTSVVEAYTLTTGLALTSKWISPDMKFTATWKWNADGTAELTLTSEDGLTVVTPDNAENQYVKDVTLAPTCTTAGSQNITVTRTYLGNNYTGNQTLEIAALGHKMTAVAAVAPKCEVAGNNAYYYCETCKLYFKDEAGNTETTVEAEVVPALVHDYNVEPVWTVEGTTATATFTCKNGCNTFEEVSAEIKESVVAPTETELGYKGQAATVTHNGKEYSYASEVTELVYHTTNEEMYAVNFPMLVGVGQVGTETPFNYTFADGWTLTDNGADTKGDDAAKYDGITVKPLCLGNKNGLGEIVYTLPVAKNIEKVVVYAGNCSTKTTTKVKVTINDAKGEAYTNTQNISGKKTITSYTYTPNTVVNGATTLVIANGDKAAKAYILEVCIYYAPDYNVTVVDGDTTTPVGVYGAEYTLPAQAGVEGYTNLGWTDGTNLYKAGDVVTLTADTTVTALYAKLAFVGGSVRTTGKLGVRYMFELELCNVTDAAITTLVAGKITVGKYNIQTSKKNEFDLSACAIKGNKIAMNFVIINELDASKSEADKANCQMKIVASLSFNILGENFNVTGTGLSITEIAQYAYDTDQLSAEVAAKYGVTSKTAQA